eukprot:m.37154 g.37154  ORF g.37154 m.37154 type:complete len:135 (+) comp5490_c0_seq1:284-688(+)
MSALGLLGRLPALVPSNTGDSWQEEARYHDSAASVVALRTQELQFQRLLQRVKYGSIAINVIGKDHDESEEEGSEGSMLSGEMDASESQSLEYPSDEDEGESPLELVMHGSPPEEEESTEQEGEDGDVDNWTFF